MDYLKQIEILNPPVNDNPEYMAWYNQVIGFALDKVLNDVSLYTHIPKDELPEEIDQTIVMMVSNLLGSFSLLDNWLDPDSENETSENGEIKRITEGDTSVEFSGSTNIAANRNARLQEALTLNSISSNFLAILNSIRRIKR